MTTPTPQIGTQRLAADVGGTFTDIAAFDPKTGLVHYGKTLTTPHRLVDGIETGVTKAGLSFGEARLFLHGSTVAINTLLERTGARTAILTTRGFRDIYEIGRVNRPDAYNLFFRKHKPLVDRAFRIEIHERINAAGEVLTALDEDQVAIAAEHLADMGIEAIAILFLHSYRNPQHEIRALEIVRSTCPNIFVSASHELSQEYREFERTSTVAANAYLGPRVAAYLDEIDGRLADAGFKGSFLVVQSSGGVYDVDQARKECIRMLESGPAGGVAGARSLSEEIGLGDAIAFDMGGTTAKAGVIHSGEPVMTGGSMIGGYLDGLPVQIPMIDIQEVGTGGGSIARVETGGALRVGPRSAGASPGPACYGFGGSEPTVTDANLLLGRLAPDRFLGGEMTLNLEAAARAMEEKICQPLGLTLTEAADGILRIATASMAHVVRQVTTDRGLDAADFAMIAYGGAGPLHATMVARELRISKVVIPHSPGHFSAFGMLASDYRRDYVRTWFTQLNQALFTELEAIYTVMETEGRTSIEEAAEKPQMIIARRQADMRYVGQEHAVTVDLPLELFAREDRDGIKRAFDAAHRINYGYADEHVPAEIVSLRVSVIGQMAKPPRERQSLRQPEPAAGAQLGNRPTYFRESGGFVDTPTFNRLNLQPGNLVRGPALIEEYASTTVIQPGDRMEVDAFGNLIIEIGRS